MNRMGQASLVVLACAALLLPWERCHGACHDRWVTPVVPHDCNHGDCEKGEEPVGEGEVDHAPADLVATAPRAPDAGAADPAPAIDEVRDLPQCPGRTVRVRAALRRTPPESPGTVVLLL